ncbi:MAG: hypothetical protein IPG63_18980 [Xanthomonadales bacterium]|nr:hypothetical protein [Xanthomonadales bacterium]MBK7144817.1 hypothetical protein [Xanthomonadales bacterium]
MTRSTSLRGCDFQSHDLPTRLFALLSIALISGCALLRTPEPLTTLQLPLADSAPSLQWPARLGPGIVQATAALQSNRVLVTKGSLLMQHEGLRWVDAPPVLVAEQLRSLHARSTHGTEAIGALDLWLTGFELRVDASGTREVVVAASATLRCSASTRTVQLAPTSATATPANAAAQSLADAFASASSEVLSNLLSAAEQSVATCAAP